MIAVLGARIDAIATRDDEDADLGTGEWICRLQGVDDRNQRVRITLSPSDAAALITELSAKAERASAGRREDERAHKEASQ